MSRALHHAPRSGEKSPALAAFRDAHAGETIVVCGCGESLKELPTPGNHITIGVNDVGRLFDPTYLVVVNPRNQFKANRFRYVEQSSARVLFTQLDLGLVRPRVVRFKLGQYGGTGLGLADVLHYAQNSPYVAVCLAAYMGARRIGLIGVDLTDHHFFAKTGRHSLAGRLREIDAQYGRLAAALEKRGVELVNLSSISRLTSLRRAHIEADGQWTKLAPPAHEVATAQAGKRRTSMNAAGKPRTQSVAAQLLDALSDTTRKLGYKIAREPGRCQHHPRTVLIVWNGRGYPRRGPTLYCEHGWLPRSSYQISPRGINAGSHIAPFAWDGRALPEEDDRALDAHLAAIRSATYDGYYRYMQADMNAATGLPPAFLLVPLQMEYDTNLLQHAPAHLRTMQALIDHVSGVNPPWPVIFKQHPMDAQRGNRHLRLRLRRRQDMLWAQARGNIHQMLKSGACRGIVTINSNVAHDSLLWNVPAVVLGRNVWPTQGEVTPFLTAIPHDWSALATSVTRPEAIACRRAYMHFLTRNQWTLADARDLERVAALIESAMSAKRAAAAMAVRSKVAVVPPRSTGPIVNVVAENRGWLFEVWKQRFASVANSSVGVEASSRPLRHADAWIFIRAREAVSTPDPARTVVQLHDLFDGGLYLRGGERSVVHSCGAVSMTHPLQREILAASGVDLTNRCHIVQPVGWSEAPVPQAAAGNVPTVAWIGRPARHAGVDVTRLELFVEAARGLRTRARVVLVGERLEAATAALRRAGVNCTVHGLAQYPQERTSAWIGAFDCVAISGAADTGPWPLFDALHAGVPTVSVRTGWAAELLSDGTCGRLVDGPESMRDAIDKVLAGRDEWKELRYRIPAHVAAFSMAVWLHANLDLAASLARQPVQRAA